jgi:hypothetical protein
MEREWVEVTSPLEFPGLPSLLIRSPSKWQFAYRSAFLFSMLSLRKELTFFVICGCTLGVPLKWLPLQYMYLRIIKTPFAGAGPQLRLNSAEVL